LAPEKPHLTIGPAMLFGGSWLNRTAKPGGASGLGSKFEGFGDEDLKESGLGVARGLVPAPAPAMAPASVSPLTTSQPPPPASAVAKQTSSRPKDVYLSVPEPAPARIHSPRLVNSPGVADAPAAGVAQEELLLTPAPSGVYYDSGTGAELQVNEDQRRHSLGDVGSPSALHHSLVLSRSNSAQYPAARASSSGDPPVVLPPRPQGQHVPVATYSIFKITRTQQKDPRVLIVDSFNSLLIAAPPNAGNMLRDLLDAIADERSKLHVLSRQLHAARENLINLHFEMKRQKLLAQKLAQKAPTQHATPRTQSPSTDPSNASYSKQSGSHEDDVDELFKDFNKPPSPVEDEPHLLHIDTPSADINLLDDGDDSLGAAEKSALERENEALTAALETSELEKKVSENSKIVSQAWRALYMTAAKVRADVLDLDHLVRIERLPDYGQARALLVFLPLSVVQQQHQQALLRTKQQQQQAEQALLDRKRQLEKEFQGIQPKAQEEPDTPRGGPHDSRNMHSALPKEPDSATQEDHLNVSQSEEAVLAQIDAIIHNGEKSKTPSQRAVNIESGSGASSSLSLSDIPRVDVRNLCTDFGSPQVILTTTPEKESTKVPPASGSALGTYEEAQHAPPRRDSRSPSNHSIGAEGQVAQMRMAAMAAGIPFLCAGEPRPPAVKAESSPANPTTPTTISPVPEANPALNVAQQAPRIAVANVAQKPLNPNHLRYRYLDLIFRSPESAQSTATPSTNSSNSAQAGSNVPGSNFDGAFGSSSQRESFCSMINVCRPAVTVVFNLLERIPQWTPDAASTHCMLCQLEFTLLTRRKHHCRCCGALVCADCSARQAVLPDLGYDTPVRVCDNCFRTIGVYRVGGTLDILQLRKEAQQRAQDQQARRNMEAKEVRNRRSYSQMLAADDEPVRTDDLQKLGESLGVDSDLELCSQSSNVQTLQHTRDESEPLSPAVSASGELQWRSTSPTTGTATISSQFGSAMTPVVISLMADLGITPTTPDPQVLALQTAELTEEWLGFLCLRTTIERRSPEIKRLVRRGIPDRLRGRIWQILLETTKIKQKGDTAAAPIWSARRREQKRVSAHLSEPFGVLHGWFDRPIHPSTLYLRGKLDFMNLLSSEQDQPRSDTDVTDWKRVIEDDVPPVTSVSIQAIESYLKSLSFLINYAGAFVGRSQELSSLGVKPPLSSSPALAVATFTAKLESIGIGVNSYYLHLLVRSLTEVSVASLTDIEKDIRRTFPDHARFGSEEGLSALRRVLAAYTIHNPDVAYCQSMNFICAILLLFLDREEDVFWALTCIVELVLSIKATQPADPAGATASIADSSTQGASDGHESTANGGGLSEASASTAKTELHRLSVIYHQRDLRGAQIEVAAFEMLVQDRLPKVAAKLQSLGIGLEAITLNWFLSVFVGCVPLECALRVWDCLLLEGPVALHRAGLALLKILERPILKAKDPSDLLVLLGSGELLHLPIDANTFVKIMHDKVSVIGGSLRDLIIQFRTAAANAALGQDIKAAGGKLVRGTYISGELGNFPSSPSGSMRRAMIQSTRLLQITDPASVMNYKVLDIVHQRFENAREQRRKESQAAEKQLHICEPERLVNESARARSHSHEDAVPSTAEEQASSDATPDADQPATEKPFLIRMDSFVPASQIASIGEAMSRRRRGSISSTKVNPSGSDTAEVSMQSSTSFVDSSLGAPAAIAAAAAAAAAARRGHQ